MAEEEKDKPNQKDLPNQVDTGQKSAFGKLPIDISEEDLNHKGVQRLLLHELRRLQTEVNYLEEFKTKFHDLDKENVRLEEKQKRSEKTEYLSKFCSVIGGVIFGLGIKLFDSSATANNSFSILLVVVGIMLVLGSLIISNKK
jgi:hypothetical protein